MRFRAADLRSSAPALFAGLGLPADRAPVVAEILLESDLLGHTTHGLGMAPRYLRSLDEGAMKREGEPEAIAHSAASVVGDGRYLPGPWLMRRAMAFARERVVQHPQVTVVLRRTHHIG